METRGRDIEIARIDEAIFLSRCVLVVVDIEGGVLVCESCWG